MTREHLSFTLSAISVALVLNCAPLVTAAPSSQTPASKAGLPRVYDFYTTWCGPCKKLRPIFDEVKDKFKEKVDMQSIDAENRANEKVVAQYMTKKMGMEVYPTIVFVNGKGEKVDSHIGLINKDDLEKKVKKLIGE